MPVYYTICPAPVPVVKGTVFNEILTLMRRFCTNKVELLTETAKKRRVPYFLRDAALSVSPDLLEFFAVLERAVEKLHVITFDYANHGYYVLGEKVASAFEDGEKFK